MGVAVRIHIKFLCLCAFLLACSNENTPEMLATDASTALLDLGVQDVAILDSSIQDQGTTGARPDEMPSNGPANLVGAEDLTLPVAAGETRAGVVDSENERLTGPEANCRIGDFRLDNAQISVCIQGESTFSQFSFFGGNIVDAHLADRPGTDAFREVFVSPALGEARVDAIGIVNDGSDGGPAVVQTQGYAQGALIFQGVIPNVFLPPTAYVTTEYRLAVDSRTVDIYTWVHIREPFSVNFRLLDFIYFGDRTRLFAPENPLGETPITMQYVAATAENVSYAWTAEFAPFGFFLSTALGIPGAPVTSKSELLGADDIKLYKRQLLIGGGDIESLRPRESGTKEVTLRGQPKAHLAVADGMGNGVTTVVLDDEGVGKINLKAGEYELRNWHDVEGPYGETLTVSEGDNIIELTQPIPATLSFSLFETDGAPTDGMIRLRGERELIHYILGSGSLKVPAGEWQVTATRGWHFDYHQETITVAAGESLELTYTFEEELPLEGLASGEFHQHASPSLDSEMAVEERVASNLAAAVDFMAPSDHDIIYPYQQLIDKMGVGDRISAPVTGMEVSPLFTHLGAYGIPYDAYAGAGGAVRIPREDEPNQWRVPEVPELIANVRESGAEWIQINHPRASQGYFDHVEYSPDRAIEDLDPIAFSTDFDSVEIFNSPKYFCRNFQDWQGLLNQGLRPTAIGNSDTHRHGVPPGYPRNYLATLSPNPANVTSAEIIDSIREGSITVGAGAVLDFMTPPNSGDQVSHDGGDFVVNVRIRTPSYTRIDRLLAIVNGDLALEITIDSETSDLVDFQGEVRIPIAVDAHLTLMALGDESLSVIRPGAPVLAFSNPIYIDVDDDGMALPGARQTIHLGLPFCE